LLFKMVFKKPRGGKPGEWSFLGRISYHAVSVCQAVDVEVVTSVVQVVSVVEVTSVLVV
jgi:hypothetical protein